MLSEGGRELLKTPLQDPERTGFCFTEHGVLLESETIAWCYLPRARIYWPKSQGIQLDTMSLTILLHDLWLQTGLWWHSVPEV